MAAQLPFRAATNLLKEVLPLNKALSFNGARDRIRIVGKPLDARIECDIAMQLKDPPNTDVRESGNVRAVGVDPADTADTATLFVQVFRWQP